MRVLVVEDDDALGQFLKKGMEREGHVVDWVADGETALAHAEAITPDLIVLDLSLPKLDGTKVLETLRSRHMDSSVLVLTGRNDLDTRVNCLDLGADDCLLKPFSFSELTARCRALLRRRERVHQQVLRYDDLVMNRMERWVMLADEPVNLTSKEFALLEYLMMRRGQCVSRIELMEQVWQMPAATGTNVVDVYINYLRRKLSGVSQDGKNGFIETIRGTGYRLGTVPVMRRPTGRIAAYA